MSNSCKECPLHGSHAPVPYVGDINSKIIIVGEAPDRNEAEKHRPFIGPNGEVLQQLLTTTNLTRQQVIIANSAKCCLNKEEGKQTNAVLKCCRNYLEGIIKKVKPKLIIGLGAIALKQLLGMQKITEKVGKKFWSEEFQCDVFITYHPSYLIRSGGIHGAKAKFVIEHFKTIRKMIENDFILEKPDTSQYKWGTDADLIPFLTAKEVAIDFETNTVDLLKSDAKVISVALSKDINKSIVLKTEHIGNNFKKIIQSPNIRKIVASRPFEELCCNNVLGINTKGNFYDVLTMGHIIEENHSSYSLEHLCDIYTDKKNIKDLAEGLRGDIEAMSEDTLRVYNGVDSDSTLALYLELKKRLLNTPKLAKYFVHFINPVQDLLSKKYTNGVLIDKERLKTISDSIADQMKDLRAKTSKYTPDSIREKYGKGKHKQVPMSGTLFLRDCLFQHPEGFNLTPTRTTKKTKAPSLDEAHLKTFKGNPFVDSLLKWRKLQKIASTYIPQIEKAIHEDGRIYPQTLLTRTVTGRTVMLNPPIQTQPKRGEAAKLLREVFIADPGWLFGSRDLAQSELRITAWLANETTMLKAIRSGVDLHSFTASGVTGTPIEKITKLQRHYAKAVNFGFIYGMSAKGFLTYAKDNYGITDLTEKEAIKYRNKYFSMCPKLRAYHKYCIDFARKHGYIQTPLGRRRRLYNIKSSNKWLREDAERQAINMPSQSFSSDLCLIGEFLFQNEIEKRQLTHVIKPLWFIHDDIFFMAKEEYIELAHKILKECMAHKTKEYVWRNFGVKVTYPIESDGTVGKTWGTMEGIDI